jgi:chromosome segregation ATPase
LGDSAVIGRQRAKTSVLKPSYSSSNFSVKSKEKLCSNTSVTILEEEDKVVIIDSDLKKQEKSDVNDSSNTEVKAIIEEFSKLINVYNKELKILAEQVKNNKIPIPVNASNDSNTTNIPIITNTGDSKENKGKDNNNNDDINNRFDNLASDKVNNFDIIGLDNMQGNNINSSSIKQNNELIKENTFEYNILASTLSNIKALSEFTIENSFEYNILASSLRRNNIDQYEIVSSISISLVKESNIDSEHQETNFPSDLDDVKQLTRELTNQLDEHKLYRNELDKTIKDNNRLLDDKSNEMKNLLDDNKRLEDKIILLNTELMELKQSNDILLIEKDRLDNHSTLLNDTNNQDIKENEAKLEQQQSLIKDRDDTIKHMEIENNNLAKEKDNLDSILNQQLKEIKQINEIVETQKIKIEKIQSDKLILEDESTHEINSLNERCKNVTEEYEALTEKNKSLDIMIELLNKEINNLKENEETNIKKIQSIEMLLNNQENKSEECISKINSLDAELNEIRKDRDNLTQDKICLEQNLDTSNKDNERLTNELNNLILDKENHNNKFDISKKENIKVHEELTCLNKDLTEVNEKLSREFADSNITNEKLEKQIDKENKDYNTLSEQIKLVNKDKGTLESLNKELEHRQTKLERVNEELTIQLNQQKDICTQQHNDLERLKEDLIENNNEKNNLEQIINNLKSTLVIKENNIDNLNNENEILLKSKVELEDNLSKDKDNYEIKIKQLEQQLHDYENKVKELISNYSSIELELAQSVNINENNKEVIIQLKEEIIVKEVITNKLSNEINTLDITVKETTNKLSQAENEVEQLNLEISKQQCILTDIENKTKSELECTLDNNKMEIMNLQNKLKQSNDNINVLAKLNTIRITYS